MIKRNRIVYIPFPVKGNRMNEYTANMVNILKQKYTILANLAEPTNVIQMLWTKAVFLNWVENDLDQKTKIRIRLHRLFGVKIIWVFHNKYPHDCDNSEKIIADMKWLADNSNIIILHARSSKKLIPNYPKNCRKAVYVPHILYDNAEDLYDLEVIRKKYGIEKTDFIFLIFGAIRPYKNVEVAIQSFNHLESSNAKLLVVGKPTDQKYANNLLEIAKDNPNVTFDFRYIPAKLLHSIISISDVVLIPYKEQSSLNSGVMIQAFSLGKTVIAPDMCMTRDFIKHRFLYVYKKDLEKAMYHAMQNGKIYNGEMGQQALQYINKYHDSKNVGNILFNVISKY